MIASGSGYTTLPTATIPLVVRFIALEDDTLISVRTDGHSNILFE